LKHWKRTSGNFFKTKWGICNSRNFCPWQNALQTRL
jgi:hypothetical protein